jgi:hypothetical protein
MNISTKIVLGKLRFKAAPEIDSMINIPFSQSTKNIIEFDRNRNIDLAELFDNEREKSTKFRPLTKITFLFKNNYVGHTSYVPFTENLYYVNSKDAARQNCEGNSGPIYWSGYPLYNEFDLNRTDNDTPGYTEPNTNGHINFVSTSASSYNWNFFISYPFQNVGKMLFAVEPKTQQSLFWLSTNGIPFIIDLTSQNGQQYITFRSVCRHGLTKGEYVELSINYNGTSLFQVSRLGDGTYGSNDFVFSIDNVGYTGNTFDTGVKGTFKRVIDGDNPEATKSDYYVRMHKILTKASDAVLTNSGFELNPFKVIKQFEPSGLTPNFVSRVSVKEGSQSYNLSLAKSIDINGIIDNQQRPLSKLYFTFQWIGYLGWTMKPTYPQSPSTPNIALRQGYDFNLPKIDNNPSEWWTTNPTQLNPNSYTSIQTLSYTKGGKVFYYNKPLNVGDTLDGDFCEWNNSEYNERVISDIYHKITYNENIFDINITGESTQQNPLGYYYKPFFPIKLRDFSSYIEEGDPKEVGNIPTYATYSQQNQNLIWRDIYPYGFKDEEGNGVDYPFINGTHYPFMNMIFRVIPEGSTYISSTLNVVESPTTDECE